MAQAGATERLRGHMWPLVSTTSPWGPRRRSASLAIQKDTVTASMTSRLVSLADAADTLAV